MNDRSERAQVGSGKAEVGSLETARTGSRSGSSCILTRSLQVRLPLKPALDFADPCRWLGALEAATLCLIYPRIVTILLTMTRLLERAISEASRLPDPEQDALASLLLEEIASETRWSAAFADSQTQLARLAVDALAEFHAGRTLPLDPERDLADH